MKYLSVAEMVAIEKAANARGLTYPQMMENAGRGLAEVIQAAYGHMSVEGALGLVGSGNNGGDTLVALAYLAEWGWPVRAYLLKARPGDDPLAARFLDLGGELFTLAQDPAYAQLVAWAAESGVLLDGVFGTGIQLPLRGEAAAALGFLKEWLAGASEPPVVVAVDCPSGVDCDSGALAPESLPAELTVTMAAIKQGLLKFPAYQAVGQLQLVGIGLPEDLPEYNDIRRFTVTGDWVADVLPARPLDSHKGTFGTALVIAGSQQFSGAALLAGGGAYRVGAGLVTLAVPELIHPALAGHFVEATWLPLPHVSGWIAAPAAEVVKNSLARVTGGLLGPGWGMADATLEFLDALLPAAGDGEALPPLVIDADGLKLLARLDGWPGRIPAGTVLTPHPGEMGTLTGLEKEAIQSDRVAVAERMAREWGHVVVLKGAFTVIAAPQGRTALIPVASPALARAGTGDVLAGIICGLRAQGLPGFEAAAAGAWLHAHAGLHAAAVLGSNAAVLAGDVLAALVDVLAELSAG